MKKKEILIIFVLAVLITGLSLFFRYPLTGVKQLGWPLKCLEKYSICLDEVPLNTDKPTCSTNYSIILKNLVIDFLFWFGVVIVLWRLLKWIKGKYGKRV